jgi:hypothetical protein
MNNLLPDSFTETIVENWTTSIPEGTSKDNYTEFMLLVLKSPPIEGNEDLRLFQSMYEQEVNNHLNEH